MKSSALTVSAGLLVAAALVLASPASAAVAGDNPCKGQDSPAWMGDSVAAAISIPSLGQPSGIAYEGTILRPADASAYPGRRPLVAIAHGSGGGQCAVFWAAKYLAGHGYVTIVFTAPGTGQLERFATNHDAQLSAVAFARSTSNPYLAQTRGDDVALAGYSLGSVSTAFNQSLGDSGIRAIVAYDTLHRFLSGDPGGVNECAETPVGEITPRVPALGFASDGSCSPDPAGATRELKLPGFLRWREADEPVAQLVMRDYVHTTFSGGGSDAQHQDLAVLTKAWLDRYLLGDGTATRTLFADELSGRPMTDVLSSTFDSAIHLPEEGIDALDLAGYLTRNAGAPRTRRLERPRKRITRSRLRRHPLRFRFASTQDDVTFSCRIDDRRFRPCESPLRVRRLPKGRHTVRVLGTDPAGLTDTRPSRWRLRVVGKRG